jgi:2-keto-3-deoxy-L-rhamnonate aldolase RhmA
MLGFRGHTLAQSFDMRARMKLCAQGKPMMGMLLGAFATPAMGRFVAQAGFDYIFLDWEHTPISRCQNERGI